MEDIINMNNGFQRRKLAKAQRGINIVRMNNGRVMKVNVK